MRRTAPRTYLFAICLILLGLACLAATGLKAGSAYYLSVAEALALPDQAPASVKLFGTVAHSGAELSSGAAAFTLHDERDPALSIRVVYAGALPAQFKPGAEVIVSGSYEPGRRLCTAQELLTKCPSKYRGQNRESAL